MDRRLSKNIAGILGPSIMVIVAGEFPLVQPSLYSGQTAFNVYLSGVLMFTAGLSIVRWHNHWARNWTVLVTFSGWSMLALGLLRVFTATHYYKVSSATSSGLFMGVEILLFLLGAFLTFKAYARFGSD